MIEIYKSEGKHPKTYIVTDLNYSNIKSASDNKKWMDFISYSAKYFKVSPNRLFMTSVWVLNDEMYLESPHKRGAKQWTAICLINKKLKELLM